MSNASHAATFSIPCQAALRRLLTRRTSSARANERQQFIVAAHRPESHCRYRARCEDTRPTPARGGPRAGRFSHLHDLPSAICIAPRRERRNRFQYGDGTLAQRDHSVPGQLTRSTGVSIHTGTTCRKVAVQTSAHEQQLACLPRSFMKSCSLTTPLDEAAGALTPRVCVQKNRECGGGKKKGGQGLRELCVHEQENRLRRARG